MTDPSKPKEFPEWPDDWPLAAIQKIEELEERLSNAVARADKAEQKMRDGWVEVTKTPLAEAVRENERLSAYAGLQLEVLRNARAHCGYWAGADRDLLAGLLDSIARIIDAALAKNPTIIGKRMEATK